MKTKAQAKKRLEELRKELRAERISYSELAELQSLKDYIEEGDIELLEAAGVSENKILNNHEVTDLIYDTLFNNGDLHELLDLNEVKDQEVEAHRGRISFTYKGRDIDISVSSKQS